MLVSIVEVITIGTTPKNKNKNEKRKRRRGMLLRDDQETALG